MQIPLHRRPPPLHASSPSHRHNKQRKPSTAPRSSFEPPKRLLGTPNSENSTVYTLRVSTDVHRGAALTDPSAAVLVCLIGEDGSSILRRISPLVDPVADAEEIMRICTDTDIPPPPGADCNLMMASKKNRNTNTDKKGPSRETQTPNSSSSRSPPPPTPTNAKVVRRFQEGSVDEISFFAPEITPLAAVILAPEQGTWRCEEIDVSSSRSGETSRFVCRDDVGDRGTHAAAFLRPVPPGGVVYGSGDATVVLTKEQAAQLREWNLQQYSEMKTTLMGATAALVAVGSGVVYASAGPPLALPFALGGVSSLVYQYLLQRRVDTISPPSSSIEPGAGTTTSAPTSKSLSVEREKEVEPGPGLALNMVLSNPAVRAALLAGGLLGSLAFIHTFAAWDFLQIEEGVVLGGGQQEARDSATAISTTINTATVTEVRQVAAGLAGFLMQKVAVIGVSAMPEKNAYADADGGGGGGGGGGNKMFDSRRR